MKHIFFLIAFLFSLAAFSQEYKVQSFELTPKDLTARLNPRVDANGRKCALLKIYVNDDIAEVQGNVIGDVIKKGMEKSVYIMHDTKHVKLLFENHFPLMITFMDYDYPSVTEQMVYEIKLVEAGANASQNPSVSSQNNSVQPIAPKKTPEEILAEAKAAYDAKDYSKALELFRKISDNAEAQCYLGYMYYNGNGIPMNKTEAVRWFRKSAEQGNARAQYNLGVMYDNGYGVPKDYAEAVIWYRKSAEQGDADAQFNLGNMYGSGDGVPMNKAEAVRWYRESAEQGKAKAQFNLGVMYDSGDGVPMNKTEAIRWYRKSAEQGYADAQFNLGNMYDSGDGVPMNKTEAIIWFRKSAEQGDADAQYNLGYMYYNGYGVGKDYSEAERWFRKSAEQGHAKAKDALRKLGVE